MPGWICLTAAAAVTIAWGEPMRFDGFPPGARGYRAASEEIQAELYRLWQWLVDLHKAGRLVHKTLASSVHNPEEDSV